ncbi:MAG TPA: hypothetical protein GX399_08110, partial [Xanthomonadaceae bacterium]|nr:hypothetical protein [Xanthomonadaceae bacterium]
MISIHPPGCDRNPVGVVTLEGAIRIARRRWVPRAESDESPPARQAVTQSPAPWWAVRPAARPAQRAAARAQPAERAQPAWAPEPIPARAGVP